MIASVTKARAQARANIALVKYWGKADADLNVPAVGSISITLDGLHSVTDVEFDGSLQDDTLLLDGETDPGALERVSRCLDLLRARSGVADRARVVSQNNFPTGAGLASSASGFAALVAAGVAALDLELSSQELSLLARQGSGSAARSIFGGFVQMHAGSRADGADSYAEELLAPDEWPLRVVIAITSQSRKRTSSSVGMQSSASTSPFYAAWIASSSADIEAAKRAIFARDFAALRATAEHSCLKLHALAMSSQPPLIYWNPATVACIEAVQSLQRSGVAAFFTIDAGPQVKVVCTPESATRVATVLRDVSGVVEVLDVGLGRGVEMA